MVSKTLAGVAGLVGASLLSPCTADADPPSFPDLSGYTPANVKDYEISVPNPGRSPDATVYFLTPDVNGQVEVPAGGQQKSPLRCGWLANSWRLPSCGRRGASGRTRRR